jgi:hypothetical protein
MKRTSTGSRLGRLALLAAILAAGLSAAEKRPKTPPAQAVVAGTVFHENGLSFPGAKVTLVAEGDSAQARKFKKIEVVTSPRGEFAIRVPAGPMNYTLTATAKGSQTQSKPVAISADERVDVFFQLSPASKN